MARETRGIMDDLWLENLTRYGLNKCAKDSCGQDIEIGDRVVSRKRMYAGAKIYHEECWDDESP